MSCPEKISKSLGRRKPVVCNADGSVLSLPCGCPSGLFQRGRPPECAALDPLKFKPNSRCTALPGRHTSPTPLCRWQPGSRGVWAVWHFQHPMVSHFHLTQRRLDVAVRDSGPSAFWRFFAEFSWFAFLPCSYFAPWWPDSIWLVAFLSRCHCLQPSR